VKDEWLLKKKPIIFFQLDNNAGTRIYSMGEVSGRGNDSKKMMTSKFLFQSLGHYFSPNNNWKKIIERANMAKWIKVVIIILKFEIALQ
jgi:hypothetical protein